MKSGTFTAEELSEFMQQAKKLLGGGTIEVALAKPGYRIRVQSLEPLVYEYVPAEGEQAA